MSFITKRERVFNEYDLFELPARNEGKLKAYSSCTDSRAWSHFFSDKSEHLVEIIKRNNESSRAKYVPTDVIVNTLMAAKNAEIARLKRKIEESEQMIGAYDQLDLTCEQKCEIANAHAAIKAANKELDDLYLNLDLSNYTEGIDSEGFQTGKSSGDEPGKGYEWHFGKPVMESKCNQVELACACDASTGATDPRIEEMQETIINKDAKLSAMQNTIAVMENDVCEPYCIYAHIYTALEKIFGILCQNDKYRLYLNLLTSGKDTRCIDIKGKILYKLKVLEKFSMALIAPCSQEFSSEPDQNESCACYRAEIVTHVEATLALTTSESRMPSLDNKRAQLVADIMEHQEMKEILSKENVSDNFEGEPTKDFVVDDYNIETENLNRLKSLQVNYDELMSCYEHLKHEKDILQMRCKNYEKLEKELEALQSQVNEYNSLWKEKEYYRRRSEGLDSLKEKYFVLSDETSTLETQLKAESEINHIKTEKIDELRNENIILEKKLNDTIITFEKEKNTLQCKLKELECKIMCQEQQIKSLSTQIDRLLEQDREDVSEDEKLKSIVLIDEVEELRDQIKNLKDAIYYSEEEKQQLQDQFEVKLTHINNLKMEIEDWKSSYDQTKKVIEENSRLSQEIEDKNTAVSNLISVLNNKSQEINSLMDEIDLKKKENRDLTERICEMREMYNTNVMALENEKSTVLDSLQLARRESAELLEKIKDYDDIVHKKDDLSRSLEAQDENHTYLQKLLEIQLEENKRLQKKAENHENDNNILVQEVNQLREMNNYAVNNMNALQHEKNEYKSSLELTRKESDILESRLSQFEDLKNQIQSLRQSHEKLTEEKDDLENELHGKASELDTAIHTMELTKKKSQDLMAKLEESEKLKEDLISLSNAYRQLVIEKQTIQKELVDKNREFDALLISLKKLNEENKELLGTSKELAVSQKNYNDLMIKNKELRNDFDNKTEEINHLCDMLKSKIEENQNLAQQIKDLQLSDVAVKRNISALQDEHFNTLDAIKKESKTLMDKLKNYENLADEFNKLKRANDEIKLEKEKISREFDKQLINFKKLEQDNIELLAHNEHVETALINARNELITTPAPEQSSYSDVLMRIQDMQQEKLINHKKIRDLLDKLEESEHIISNLAEDVLAREGRIVILENHINSLEDEVRRLHKNLDLLVDTGEQIKDSYHKIDQSMYTMEAHHSKTTHDMKLELAKLQNDNAKLEQNLSVTKQKSDESFRERHKYASQIIHLQNEREIIITDIKQLELESVGDTALSPDNCNMEDISLSLDRIRNYLHARNSKSSTLEQTILKVQTSSQLLLSKADEAKKLVEKEKQKITTEKEEAVMARLNMEKQLSDLKEKLEKQTCRDKGVIKDLEAEILNQKLIIDKINKSTQSYICKLEEEMRSLQNMYQNSLDKMKELQDNVQKLSNEKCIHDNIIDKISKDLERKSKEVSILQKNLEELKVKPQMATGVQVTQSDNYLNMASQTDKSPQYSSCETTLQDMEYFMTDSNKPDDGNVTDINILKINKIHPEKHGSDLLLSNKLQPVNEVHILTANVEPTFDFVKSTYLNYKLTRLSPGRLEQHSISCIPDNTDSNIEVSMFPSHSIDQKSFGTEKTYDEIARSPRVVDIYNREFMYIDSTINDNTGKYPQSATKSSAFTGFGLTNDLFESDIIVNNDNNFIGSVSRNSTDKDLFVIYQDSESNQVNNVYHNKDHWQKNTDPELLIETMTVQLPNKCENYDKKQIKPKLKILQVQDEFYQDAEDDFLKQRLNIELPRVDGGTPSLFTSSEGDNKSTDSYILAIYPSDKKIECNNNKARLKDVNESHEALQLLSDKRLNRDLNHEKLSHHTLSRVEANFLLIKNKKDPKQVSKNESKKIGQAGNFGLEYILDAVQRQIDPEIIKTYNTIKAPRRSRSDEMITQTKDLIYSSSSKLSQFREVSVDKTESHFSPNSDAKSVTERSILVKMDDSCEYEKKIQYLTTTLQNVEKDYKKKIEAIKVQYDNNIKNIINEHNEGVQSIQNLHEETLQDIIKIHENEVENLRAMSIEAMRKADILDKENHSLKFKIRDCCSCLDEEPVKFSSSVIKKRKSRSRDDTKMLTKTNVEAFNVKPKVRGHGPCTCSVDINISDTIRTIFQQVDVEQRKLAEQAYLKYIANKISSSNVDALDSQELSFLHLKVCRTWKSKLGKEEALQKRIDSLENELLNKQRHAQEHIAELDRKVAEERRRLQEVREAVCRNSPNRSREGSPASASSHHSAMPRTSSIQPSDPPPPPTAEKDIACKCDCQPSADVSERRSAGDLPGMSCVLPRIKRTKETNRAVLAKLCLEERREKRLFNDEPPTRLRRTHDRPPQRSHKK